MFHILKQALRSHILKSGCASIILGTLLAIMPVDVKTANATSVVYNPHGGHYGRHFRNHHRFHHRRHFKRHRHHRHHRHYYRGHRGFHFGFHGPRYYGPSYYGHSYYGGGYPVPVAQPVPVPQPVYCPVPVAVPVAVPSYTSGIAVGPVHNVFRGGGCY